MAPCLPCERGRGHLPQSEALRREAWLETRGMGVGELREGGWGSQDQFLGPRTVPERSPMFSPAWEKAASPLLSEYANGNLESRRKMCGRWGVTIPGRRITNGQ